MSLKDDNIDNIPLADDDPQVIIEDSNDNFNRTKSIDSLPSIYNDGSSSGASLEPDINNPDEQEEKARLISQVLELQNTLDGMQWNNKPAK